MDNRIQHPLLHYHRSKFRVIATASNGDCLFRAMAYHIFEDQTKHALLRVLVIFNIRYRWKYFKEFAPDEDSEVYRRRMQDAGIHGGEFEIRSFTNYFNCKVHVYFKCTPEREPVIFGTTGPVCYMLCNERTDGAHFDVLEPKGSSSLAHMEAVTSWRHNLYQTMRKELNRHYDLPNVTLDEIAQYAMRLKDGWIG